MKQGQIIKYNVPGMKLISEEGIETGKLIRLSAKGNNVLVEDTEIQPGEKKLYQHWIHKSQIVSPVNV